MDVALFDFDLPQECIALRPVHPRENAKLLCAGAQGIQDFYFYDLPQLLNAGDCLVFNNTKVFPARLRGVRFREGQSVPFEMTLIKQHEGGWLGLGKPLKRLKVGDLLLFTKGEHELRGVVRGFVDEMVYVVFELAPVEFMERLMDVGEMPLPPYIEKSRPADAQDFEDYQTGFAQNVGSVAAPTAGLHFSKTLLHALRERGVEFAFVTLHVGLGTFLPVKVANTLEHKMHAEWGDVSAQTIAQLEACKARGGRVVCVGTTSARLLESAAASGELAPFCGYTDIFMTPGYAFKAVDGLITNFHLPKSTLFMLVSAFVGLTRAKEIYNHAIKNAYRFYSYGDGSLLWRGT